MSAVAVYIVYRRSGLFGLCNPACLDPDLACDKIWFAKIKLAFVSKQINKKACDGLRRLFLFPEPYLHEILKDIFFEKKLYFFFAAFSFEIWVPITDMFF